MKCLFAAALALLLASALPTRAAQAEDQYLAILYLIQQGDAANTAGANAEALARYTSALSALQQLQRANPTWETRVVSYRLGYLTKRVAALGAAPIPPAPPTSAASPTPAPATPPTPAIPAETQVQLNTLQAQLQQSQADNNLLRAKLREALAARPASVDPAQVAQAEERIRQLTKENDLLKISLNEAQGHTVAGADPAELSRLRRELEEGSRNLAAANSRAETLAREKTDLEERLSKSASSPKDQESHRELQRRLDEANQKLAGQAAANARLFEEKNALSTRLAALESEAASAVALRAENELIKRQLADLKASNSGATGQDRLSLAEAQIVALQSEREALQLERAALEERLKQAMGSPKTATASTEAASAANDKRIKQLEQERDALSRQLAARQDSGMAAKLKQSTQELTALRARLEVYEAKAVPYTADELALFRQAPPKLAVADQPAHRNYSIPKPPPGMSQTVLEAQRYFVRGDYAQAEQRYQEVLRKDDNNVYTLGNLAAIQLEAGKLDEAEKNLTKALALAPDDGYTIQTMGYLRFRQGKYDDALNYLGRAAQINPDSAEVQNYLGVTLSHKGLRNAAESALRKAIALEPNYGSAHNNLAVIYATQNPPFIALAKMHYQKALEAGHPKNPELEKMFEQKSASSAQ
jgi:Flp pilus assembly protein TadD